MKDEELTPGAAGPVEQAGPSPAEAGAEPSLRDMEAQIAQALAQAREAWAAEEQERLEAAVAAERVRCDDLLRQNALERQLREAGLDPAFAPFLKGGPEADDGARLALFAGLVQGQITAALAEKLRGGEPPRAPEPPRGYDRDSLKRMSPREINERWEDIVAALGREG
ncbi:MAG: hypothetical protein LUF84_06835 [Clostridiales bacterium]|nr:hypothetical protein [Clostridiales bacterium]